MPPLPDYMPPTLAAIHARRAQGRWQGRGNTFIGASEAANECARAIWYGFRWASPPENLSAQKIRLFETGDIEERRILDDLAAIEGVDLWRVDPETGKQFRNEIAGYIAVKPDAVAVGLHEAPVTPHIVECKSANDKNFKPIKAKGVEKAKPEHWLQAQLEMLGLGLKRALYFLVSKNTDEEYLERIKIDVEAAERAVARLVSIAEAPRPPGKIREDTAKPPCLWCRHRDICHDGEMARVNCRTCLHATPCPSGVWQCEFWHRPLTPEEQDAGCPSHLFIPDLVAGEQIDADPVLNQVTYRLASGETWVDGAAGVAL